MKRFSPATYLFFLLFGATLVACGDDPPAPPPPRAYGLPCATADVCESKLCIDGRCSKLCSKFADCPPAGGKYFFCGQATPDTIACYPRPDSYVDQPFTTGHDCSVDGKCAVGWRCMGLPGDKRTCSPLCESDKDCPPKLRCSSLVEGDKPVEKRCMPRQWGHPCTIDDDCGGAEDLCITDKTGAKYCSKACAKNDPGTCPTFATCEDAGNSKLQCKHKAGIAYTKEGELCAPCIAHYEVTTGSTVTPIEEDGGCGTGGHCLRLSPYTNETACALPCATDFEKSCTGDGDCTHRCVDTGGGVKKCSYCAQGFGCTKATSLCIPIMANPEPPPDTIIGTCFQR